jgi:hypothetical protein
MIHSNHQTVNQFGIVLAPISLFLLLLLLLHLHSINLNIVDFNSNNITNTKDYLSFSWLKIIYSLFLLGMFRTVVMDPKQTIFNHRFT